MSAVVIFLLWCALAVVSAFDFIVTPVFSENERTRRLKHGNEEAQEEQRALDDVPLLRSLQRVITTLLASVLITYCVTVYGVVTGVLIGTILVLCLPLVFRLAFVCQLVDKLDALLHRHIEKLTQLLRFPLSLLRERAHQVPMNILHSQDELLELVRRSPGVLSRDEQSRLVMSLRFDHTKVTAIMVPREAIIGVPATETLGPLVLNELYKTGHDEFPVYQKDLSHIVGMLSINGLFIVTHQHGSKLAKQAMQGKAFFIREEATLLEALHGLIAKRQQLLIVTNTYGETVGLLSLHDVIETLLGSEIRDDDDAIVSSGLHIHRDSNS